MHASTLVIAFSGHKLLAQGPLSVVALQIKPHIDEAYGDPVLIFEDATSQPVEVDFRGNPEDLIARLSLTTPEPQGEIFSTTDLDTRRGPGRPKLGVVAREVTLLPRHWDWLNGQPGGASVALRKLVEEARKTHADRDQKRQSIDALHRFLHAVAGNLSDFEEVNRAFYAGDYDRMRSLMLTWPAAVREHVEKLVDRVTPSAPSPV